MSVTVKPVKPKAEKKTVGKGGDEDVTVGQKSAGRDNIQKRGNSNQKKEETKEKKWLCR